VKLAYTAGPYRSEHGTRGIIANIRAAEAVAVELWRLGFAVICPHLNSALLDGVVPDAQFLAGDLLMMERCDLVVMFPRWRQSEGAKREREHAIARGISVYEWPGDVDKLRALASPWPGNRTALPRDGDGVDGAEVEEER